MRRGKPSKSRWAKIAQCQEKLFIYRCRMEKYRDRIKQGDEEAERGYHKALSGAVDMELKLMKLLPRR